MTTANFSHCPRCESANIEDTDYEIETEDGETDIDENGVVCADCG